MNALQPITVETFEGTTQLTFNVHQICPSFYHNISGIIEDQDGEFYAMVMNEMYDEPEAEKFFPDFDKANAFVVRKMNELIKYYKINFGAALLVLSIALLASCNTMQEKKYTPKPMDYSHTHNYMLGDICPDCREIGCIYQQINRAVIGEPTDANIQKAVYAVCRFRGITDPKMIEIILANYYL